MTIVKEVALKTQIIYEAICKRNSSRKLNKVRMKFNLNKMGIKLKKLVENPIKVIFLKTELTNEY